MNFYLFLTKIIKIRSKPDYVEFVCLVKIGSVTAEILLICTNVTRTNVAWTNIAWTNIAWTNVTVSVEICLDFPRNLSLKFHQNLVS